MAVEELQKLISHRCTTKWKHRKVFRYYISLTGLNEVYDTTEESSPNRTKRRLFRLTTYSLRHFGITTFNRAVGGDIMLTKAYARHREISSTQVYVHTLKEELYGAIEKAFSNKNPLTIKNLEWGEGYAEI